MQVSIDELCQAQERGHSAIQEVASSVALDGLEGGSGVGQ